MSNHKEKMSTVKPLLFGTVAFVAMLAVYFAVVGLISGLDFTLAQFARFWPFLVLLALGFGIQIGLYVYLKALVGRPDASGKVIAVSGTTSTAAMVSCCAHYLANILPMLGVAGFLTLVAQYQIELFWVGASHRSSPTPHCWNCRYTWKARRHHGPFNGH